MSALAPTLQLFFTERLARQRQASPCTLASYRNTFRLLLRFVQDRTGKAPSTLDWEDLTATAAVLRAWLQERGGLPANRCSPPAPDGASATTPSNTASRSTRPAPH